MPTFERCPPAVNELANAILCSFPSHRPLLDSKVKVDYVFAFPDTDDDGRVLNDALKHNGVKALGICRKIPLKDRAMGRGDAEISLDGEWWKTASEEEQRALLDHELHHIEVKVDNRGPVRDDLGRPVLKLRKHDFQFGWFTVIAHRHGEASQERQMAKVILDEAGQYYWPTLITVKGGKPKEVA